MSYGYGWAPYVSLGKKQAKAKQKLQRLAKKGLVVQPIEEFKGKITQTFWGNQWCDHIESFQDVANRLERGRSYVRNGSVCHLAIEPGKVSALVAGSEPYDVVVNVEKIKPDEWEAIKGKVAGQIDSLLDLLQGKISDEVMARLADKKDGLFPKRNELSFTCNCLDALGSDDWVCKHIAAVFYGIGRRFETNPELLFTLRGVDCAELIAAGTKENLERCVATNVPSLKNDELENIFGIELAPEGEEKTSQKKDASKTPEIKIAKTSKKTTSRKKTSKTEDVGASVAQTTSRKKTSKTEDDKASVVKTTSRKKASKAEGDDETVAQTTSRKKALKTKEDVAKTVKPNSRKKTSKAIETNASVVKTTSRKKASKAEEDAADAVKPTSRKKTSKTVETNASVVKPTSRKKTSSEPEQTKTASLAMRISASDRAKLNKAAEKSHVTRNAFIVARLKESDKRGSESKATTRKLKRSKKDVKKDVLIIVQTTPAEKKRVQAHARRAKKSTSQFVYDLLFEE